MIYNRNSVTWYYRSFCQTRRCSKRHYQITQELQVESSAGEFPTLSSRKQSDQQHWNPEQDYQIKTDKLTFSKLET